MNMKKKLYLFAVVLLSSCGIANNTINTTKEISAIEHDDFKEMRTILDIFEQFEIVPLESSESTLLTNAQKIEVDDSLVFVYDKSAKPSLSVFNVEGEYITKVGAMGHATNEYLFIDDFTLDKKNRKVLLLSNGDVLIYDYSGRFDKRIKLSDEFYCTNIVICDDGLVGLSSNRHPGTNLLHFFDENFKFKNDEIESLPKPIEENALSNVSLQVSNENVCFLDFFRSRFVLVNHKDTKKHLINQFRSNRMLNDVSVLSGDFYQNIENYDFITDFHYDGDEIFGWMFYGKELKYFTMLTQEDTFDVYAYGGWNPQVICHDNDLFYCLIKPGTLLSLIDTNKEYVSKTNRLFSEIFEKYKSCYSLKSNYSLVRMKRKER